MGIEVPKTVQRKTPAHGACASHFSRKKRCVLVESTQLAIYSGVKRVLARKLLSWTGFSLMNGTPHPCPVARPCSPCPL